MVQHHNLLQFCHQQGLHVLSSNVMLCLACHCGDVRYHAPGWRGALHLNLIVLSSVIAAMTCGSILLEKYKQSAAILQINQHAEGQRMWSNSLYSCGVAGRIAWQQHHPCM